MTAAITAAVLGVGATIYGANEAADAAKATANTQAAASQAGIDEQRRQFDLVQSLLQPYVASGNQALSAQGNLIGLNGSEAQQQAYNALMASPAFTSMLSSGENALLQNASATGGLRGGNTQAALAQFRPALLSQLVNQQYSNLGGLTSLGQNAAAGVGNAGMQTGNNVASLLAQQGAAVAGGQLAQGAKYSDIASALSGSLGLMSGLGVFGGSSTSGVAPAAGTTYTGSGTYNFGNLGL